MLLCRELGSFLSRINRYAFISGGQHRKLRHWDIHILCKLEFKRRSGQECTWASRLFFNIPPFFFFFPIEITVSRHTISFVLARLYFTMRKDEETSPSPIKFRYVTAFLTSDFFFSRRTENKDLLSITKLNLVRVNPPNTISENYVHWCVHFNVIIWNAILFHIFLFISFNLLYRSCCFVYFF